MRRVFLGLGIVIACAVLIAFAGCGGSNKGFDTGGDPDAAVTADGGDFDGLFGGDSGQRTLGCSPDLRSVIDEQGNLLTTCPPEQGCSGGTCIAACEAAARSKGNVGCDFVVSTPMFYTSIT